MQYVSTLAFLFLQKTPVNRAFSALLCGFDFGAWSLNAADFHRNCVAPYTCAFDHPKSIIFRRGFHRNSFIFSQKQFHTRAFDWHYIYLLILQCSARRITRLAFPTRLPYVSFYFRLRISVGFFSGQRNSQLYLRI